MASKTQQFDFLAKIHKNPIKQPSISRQKLLHFPFSVLIGKVPHSKK